MSFNMTGAITGAAVTGLTTPTFTLSADSAVDGYTRQSTVTALGGTQTGAIPHSVSAPFTVTVNKPRTLRTLGKANLNGFVPNVGRNTYRILFRKGVVPLVGQPYQTSIFRCEFEVPAGSEMNDQPNLKSFLSFIGGFLSSNASGIFDTSTNAVL